MGEHGKSLFPSDNEWFGKRVYEIFKLDSICKNIQEKKKSRIVIIRLILNNFWSGRLDLNPIHRC